MSYGVLLKEVRKKKKMRQVDLAAASGISQSNISKLEHGQLGPSLIDAIKLAQVLKVDIKYFITALKRGK